MTGATGPAGSGVAATRAVADEHVRALARLDPAAAQVLGADPEVLVPDLSPDGWERRRALDGATLAALQALSDAGPPDALRAAMTERLGSDAALHDSGFTTGLLAPLATPAHLLRQLFDNLPTAGTADWERVAVNLRAAAAGYRDWGTTLRWSAARFRPPAARQVRGVAAAVRSWTDPAGIDYYRGLVAGAEVAPALERELVDAAEQVSAAADGFADLLERELAPSADPRDGVGRERYAVTSAAFLGTEADPDELYRYGWAELARLGAQARALAGSLTGSADLPAAREALDARQQGRVPVGAALVDWLQGRLDAAADQLWGHHFSGAPAPVEARMVTAGSGVLYYTPADPAGTRPGRVWWSVPPGTASVPTWREVSTVHHEGLPGHHLQHAVTAGLADLHPWQRHLCHVHGYAEGWAHYAEQLAVELGLVRDDAELLGVLDAQLWRAARIVVDIGLHLDLPIPAGTGLTDAGRWTPEVGADLLHRAAGVDPSTARFEVERYLGWPGQALAFRVGARLIGAIRSDAERRPGFDRRAFHDGLLALGPMGLGPLARQVATG
ncbi:DUF885 domain-containing protein [Nakamurella endophytica]|uniref:DUF885 domain-containing protein n=1 Tax=Nakamurella endophytica TaxID=1748367 RepID=A0A917WJJ9_9ACTN|nr:DUF885 domain-containing protein [Nakamurella endophytica]GGM08257.1 hypothetical protein GCM10011594_30310 [Nakamurella endophytica]